MAQFDRHWIRARLSGRRGEQSALARAMGIDADKMSKIMRGERQIKITEIPGLLKFFDVPFETALSQEPHAATPSGFAESDATAFAPQDGDGSKHLLAAFLASNLTPEVFKARTAAPGFGILQGDLLAVDMTPNAQPGDLVLVTVADTNTGNAQTLLRRYQPPFILSGTIPAAIPQQMTTTDGSMAIMGIIRAVLRRT